ncbi:MAG TPA: Calx-beta domain-containing protein [Lacunisphaera sp.]|nr:Calx-beta domain-containing protein [Lacunisphaera sp.]
MPPLASVIAASNAAGSARRDEFAAFQEWTRRYLAANPAGRDDLLAEGIDLARARRVKLKELIRLDPKAALGSAVPMVERQQLPPEVVDLLELRVSGKGRVSLLAVTPRPGLAPPQPIFRSALVAGEEYQAFVYGRRAVQATVDETSILGIAVDGNLAVDESPLRVLEKGEVAGSRPLETICAISGRKTPAAADTPLNVAAGTAVEFNGKVQVLCHVEHVAELERRLLADEVSHLEGDNQPGTSGVSGRPDAAWTHGTKKMLVIRVDFPDLPGTPKNSYVDGSDITPDTIANVINAANGVKDFYVNGSYNQTTIQLGPTSGGVSPDVTPVLRMPQPAAYYAQGDGSNAYNDTLHSDARAAALAAGYDEANYDRVGVVFSALTSLSSSLINYGGLGEVIGKDFWVNGEFDLRVVAHEVGHNYGLNHANLWQVSDGNPISSGGTSVEYGDVFDVMGSGSTSEHEFTHWNKSILQWIPDAAVTLAAASGTYRIYRFDGGVATNLSNPRALKIVRDATRDYWIGYRRGTSNASLNGGAYVLWGYNQNQQGNLLDLTTPGTNPSGVHDEGLAMGATFNDTAAGIAITPTAQGGSGADEWLDVQLVLQPKIQWSKATFQADEQLGRAVLTLSRTQNSSGAVSINYSTAPGTATAPADFTAQSGTVTWADGDMADKTITIPLVADAVAEGTESFTVTLSGASGGVIGGSATATVSILDPGVRDPAFVPDLVDSTIQRLLVQPDGSIVIAGWLSRVYDSSFTAHARGGIARLTPAGKFDATFAAGGGAAGGNLYGGGYTVLFDLARQPDGKIIAVGEFASFNGTARNRIVRLLADGTVDSTFDPGSGANDVIYAVAVQPDGKIIVAGAFTSFNGTSREYIARLNADGTVDSSFVGPDFGGTGGWSINSLALQPDGKVLAGGAFYTSNSYTQYAVCRLLTTGGLDPAFDAGMGPDGSVNVVRIQADGRILVGGSFSNYTTNGGAGARGGLARLTSTGALDAAFVPSAIGVVNSVLPQPDGKIVVGASYNFSTGTSPSRYLGRVTGTGANDPTFAAAGDGTAGVYDFALLPDGRLLFAGDHTNFQGSVNSSPIWRCVAGLPALPGIVQLGSATFSGNENTTVAVTVTRTGGSAGALSVGYATVSGTATSADFSPVSGALTWADGDSAPKSILIPLSADLLIEGTETFTFNLGEPVLGGATLGAVQRATVQINDVPAGFAGWKASKFTSGELADANISGPNAVYGQDGLPNLVKYALGLEPKQNITTGLPGVTASGGNWIYTYSRPDDRTDITYSVEVSLDLIAWATANNHQMVSSAGGMETWTASYPQASAPNVFFRLRISQ